jgi:hypothetical protein
VQLSEATVAQIELDLEAARTYLAEAQLKPAIDEGTKLLAAAIAQAGAQIAVAIAGSGGSPRE